MITKDSLRKVGNRFEEVWRSTLQLPYRAIILIDDSSDDSTRRFVENFAERHGKELIVERSRLYGNTKPTRATARQTAIDIFFENYDDEWLVFLDDDFILSSGFWKEASQYVEEPAVGLIWGVDYTPHWDERLKWLEARGISERQHAVENFKRRGGLHDTLLRRKAIEEIKIPPWLHVYEDAYVKLYVECRGWQWRVVNAGGVHLRMSGEDYTQKDFAIMVEAVAQLKIERVPFWRVLGTAAALPGYIYYSWRAYRNVGQGLNIWRHRMKYRLGVWWRSLRIRGSTCERVQELNAAYATHKTTPRL